MIVSHLLLLLLGCAPTRPDHVIYTEAVHTTDYAQGVALCQTLADPELRGDCTVVLRERHKQWDDCDLLEGRWASECHFLAAEALGREGSYPTALERCQRSDFGKNCEVHIVGMIGTRTAHLTVAEADEALKAVYDDLHTPIAAREFWRAWFRGRIMRSMPVDPTECTRPVCTAAGWTEVEAGTRRQRQAVGREAYCAGDVVPVWAGAGVVEPVTLAAERWCNGPFFGNQPGDAREPGAGLDPAVFGVQGNPHPMSPNGDAGGNPMGGEPLGRDADQRNPYREVPMGPMDPTTSASPPPAVPAPSDPAPSEPAP